MAMMVQASAGTTVMARYGFSLLELTVVLAIGGLLAGIAVPRLGAASARYQADFAARAVARDFDRARNNARLTSATQTITFGPANDRYTVTGTSTGATAGYSVNLLNSHGAKIIDVSFTGKVATFNAFGECVAGGTVTIRYGNYTRTITLDEASGRARWQ